MVGTSGFLAVIFVDSGRERQCRVAYYILFG